MFMNKQRERHMAGGEEQHGGQEHALPHIFVHSHSKGHTVHIHHADGGHEKHEHSHGDAEGIAAHIHEHLGGGAQEGEQRPEENAGEMY
jgi:hypothetical protein